LQFFILCLYNFRNKRFNLRFNSKIKISITDVLLSNYSYQFVAIRENEIREFKLIFKIFNYINISTTVIVVEKLI